MSYLDIDSQIQQVIREFGGLSAEWIDIARNLLVAGNSVEEVIDQIRRQRNFDEPPAENGDDGPQG